MQSLTFRINPRLAFAGVVCFLASTGVRADSLHVTAADALSNKAYDLKFAPPPGATVLGITPLPANPRSSVRSIVYVANEQTAKADLIAADNRSSLIVRYAGAAGPANTVWSGTGSGPKTPIGLSVDSFGNLFACRGDQGHPELWVLKPNPVQPPAGGAFLAPVLIDKTSFGTSGQTRLMDTLVVRTSVAGGLGAGDLLVLVSDGRVLRYSAVSIASFLAGHGLIGTPTTLIAASFFTQGHIPTSMAIWPTDGSLLIPTVDGAVRRYSLTPTGSTPMPNFATGLASEATGVGQLLGLVKTFVSSNGSFAVLDNPQRNKIFELGAPPPAGCPNLAVVCNPPLATITTVSNPVGLAVTDASAASLDCVNTVGNPSGCALLGGALKVGTSSDTPPPANGSVIAVSCTVDDPRFTGPGCDGSSLLVSSVCPGYPDNYVPPYLCGAAGASHHAMTFLKFEEANGLAAAPNDLLVNVELSAEAIVGAGGGIPLCPQLTMGWAPLAGEGGIPEGNVMMEPTSYCGSSRGLPPGHSLMLVGAQINFGTDLVGLANDKFDALSRQSPPIGTIQAATNMNPTAQAALASCVDHGKTLLNATSLTTTNRYACAAHQAWTCDQTVVAIQFNLNPNKLSALSAIKGRLENLIMHIDNRIISPGSTPPVPPQPDPLPGAATVATCDITAPTAPTPLGFNEDSSDGTTTTYTVSWSASNDVGEGNSANPGPYASGIQRYHLYVGTGEVTGSPTGASPLQFTISDTAPTSHSVTITADDNATGGVAPVFNTSAPSAALPVQCIDQNPADGTCDQYPPPPP
jgi:hypothetical protein